MDVGDSHKLPKRMSKEADEEFKFDSVFTFWVVVMLMINEAE